MAEDDDVIVSAKDAYPLGQVLQVKQRRVEDAEKVVKEKRLALEKEQKILADREADRDKAKKHYDDKLKQMRDELDGATTSPKVQQMKVYLKIVKERIVTEEKRVQEQKKQVEKAEKILETAQADLKQKRLEVDKLQSHRKDWLKDLQKEQEVVAGREQDELGSVIFMARHHREKR
ncbi:MAG: type III secretion T3S chaperone [Parachlamydiaceae bacterium]